MAEIKTTPQSGLKAERDRFVALTFCWADLVLELDEDQRVVFAGGATRPFFGKDPDALKGEPLVDLVSSSDRPLVRQLLQAARRNTRIENVHIQMRGARGPTPPLAFTGYWLEDLGRHYFLALRVAPGLRGAASRYDREPGSGLIASQSFADAAQARLKEMQVADKNGKLTLIQIPGLAKLRAKMDEDAAESMMSTLTACLRAASAGGDTAGQISDGQYGIVHDAALDVAELEGQLAEVTKAADPTGAGAGVQAATVEIDPEAVTEEDLAKGLVYTINRFRESSGAGFSIQNLSSNMSTLIDEAMQNVNKFKHVVASDAFSVAFQPIIDVRTGKIHHYEALARFNSADPNESPYKYITFAEETGLIPEFDIAMATKVVNWLAQRPGGRYSVAVNISGSSVGDLAYIERLQKLLANNQWLKGQLMFEITESSRMADLHAANKFVQDLRKHGYPVCLDDFGAGAASFQYLSTLEIDVVKLDGSAIKNARAARKGKAFLQALTNLCRNLGVETIAEMIDEEDGLRFVRDCGVEYAQGFLFGRPDQEISNFKMAKFQKMFPLWPTK